MFYEDKTIDRSLIRIGGRLHVNQPLQLCETS